ncbi:hypothetical protein [Streptomyces coffeae]|uniref:Uncharacterized protein n=1 Tax=Streptomyces coffeae TaxID=621382 RepID=A0ABS1NJ80_9ACTN|nr:hypothetical protein [Streptomyces coffeae]MBL1100128.1 hypothetical protein [Streptomyces coffeae]
MTAAALVFFGASALAAALGLAVIGRAELHPIVLPVVRTTALIVVIAAAAAAALSH